MQNRVVVPLLFSYHLAKFVLTDCCSLSSQIINIIFLKLAHTFFLIKEYEFLYYNIFFLELNTVFQNYWRKEDNKLNLR